ncbi:hypothetical protein L3X39_07255 [Sabulilitoribacter multivorans]|uniref:Transmembrane family 220, helix n=1 Tax=Flaviramulus multivorans TaxID=1304750 RepID=A0ABS9IIF5_9FLAO|nr:hypothetical protein [Flaviramulus multivorans]MCF7560430.1 hypothetical protein [Flaviramulus multivorans]
MSPISRYTKLIPYLYFIAISAYWFTDVNRHEGIYAYPILLFAIPFIWQIFKPNKKLNFVLGITFVCLSSYLILAYLYDITSFTDKTKKFFVYGGLFVFANFAMALWIIRNSLKENI